MSCESMGTVFWRSELTWSLFGGLGATQLPNRCLNASHEERERSRLGATGAELLQEGRYGGVKLPRECRAWTRAGVRAWLFCQAASWNLTGGEGHPFTGTDPSINRGAWGHGGTAQGAGSAD